MADIQNMEEEFKKYQDFTALEFALDEDFVLAVWQPWPEGNRFRESLKEALPHQAANIEQAAKMVMAFRLPHTHVSKEVKARIWHRVLTDSAPAKVIASRFLAPGWIVAASIVLLLGLSVFTYIQFVSKPENSAEVSTKTFDMPAVLPGGNKAILTLGDGSHMVLDSLANGKITSEGDVTVVKLDDGELSYQSSPENKQSTAVTYNTITTPRGGQYRVVLADGSKIWLNASSTLTFPTTFSGKERRVTVEGEAYFEVMHDASKPFHVTTGDMKVEVLGTHFNINAYADEGLIKTTLLEGKVKVLYGDAIALLKPGQQAQLQKETQQLQTKNIVNTAETVAWKDGFFQFDNSTLKEVMQQLARWYDVQVDYPEKLSTKKFGGSISMKSDLQQVLQILEESGVTFKLSGRAIRVER